MGVAPRVRRVTVVIVALALLAAACGGGASSPDTTDDVGEPSTAPDLGDRPTAPAVAAAAVELLGDDMSAALAILIALDRGYTFSQVVDAVLAGSLRANGVVVADGGVVAPAGVASDLIVDKGPLEAEASSPVILAAGPMAGGGLISVGDFFEHFGVLAGLVEEATREPPPVSEGAESAPGLEGQIVGVEATLGILSLGNRGFSAQQIIEALIFGEIECGWLRPDMFELPGGLDEERKTSLVAEFLGALCEVRDEAPENDAERGVLALPEIRDGSQVVSPDPGTGQAVRYVGEWAGELVSPPESLIEVLENEVILDVAGDTMRLRTTLSLTAWGDEELLEGGCWATAHVTSDWEGVAADGSAALTGQARYEMGENTCDFERTVGLLPEVTMFVEPDGGGYIGRDEAGNVRFRLAPAG